MELPHKTQASRNCTISDLTSGLRSREEAIFKIIHAVLFLGGSMIHNGQDTESAETSSDGKMQADWWGDLRTGTRLTHGAERNNAAANSEDGPTEYRTK